MIENIVHVELIANTPDPERTIVEVARVSSSRKNKTAKYAGLVRYLLEHKHFSPFEHATFTFEIETSKAIGIQLIRHRSFSFQEFSQRYQDVNQMQEMFEPLELRKQCEDNRQSSTEVFNPEVRPGFRASELIDHVLSATRHAYDELIKAGVAREQARFILPLCTSTKIHMTGNVRSWIHFLELRDDEHAQKEIQLVAKEIKSILADHLPTVAEALNWKPNE
jgi:thymidylate synthase (FAD)